MLQSHQQTLFARRYDIGQVLWSGHNTCVKQTFEFVLALKNPGIAESGTPDQHAMYAGGGNALCGLVERFNVAIAQNQCIGLAHDLSGSSDSLPVCLTFIMLNQCTSM